MRSPFKAIDASYPDKYYPWEFNKTSNGYGTKENGIKAKKWLLSEKLKIQYPISRKMKKSII